MMRLGMPMPIGTPMSILSDVLRPDEEDEDAVVVGAILEDGVGGALLDSAVIWLVAGLVVVVELALEVVDGCTWCSTGSLIWPSSSS